MAEIVTAAWALVVHDCDVKAGHVMETISSRYSRIPASVPEKRNTWTVITSKGNGRAPRYVCFSALGTVNEFSRACTVYVFSRTWHSLCVFLVKYSSFRTFLSWQQYSVFAWMTPVNVSQVPASLSTGSISLFPILSRYLSICRRDDRLVKFLRQSLANHSISTTDLIISDRVYSQVNHKTCHLPGVFSSQISSHKDSLELELLPAVNITIMSSLHRSSTIK